MDNTCCTMCACPLEKFSLATKTAKLTVSSKFIHGVARYSFSHFSVGDLVKAQGLLWLVEFAHTRTYIDSDGGSSPWVWIYRERNRSSRHAKKES